MIAKPNPWLGIPLAEYESHMSLPQVAQARLLGDVFENILREYRPHSVAVLGCSGGNGFERISTTTTTRVIGVDLNAGYVDELRARFQERIPNMELLVGDIQREDVGFAPVDLVFAALVLEYVDVEIVLRRVRTLLTSDGVLGTVVQLSSPAVSPVTPSTFARMQSLTSFMRLVSPEQLEYLAKRTGFHEVARRLVKSIGGKQFQVQVFRTA